ncbi:hypothetical protein BGZ82_011118 [Podila clonocystis]|nr:hypothetical protein BGZ82_011118 [Podila clonocystis]
MLFKISTIAALATSIALVSAQAIQMTPCAQCMVGTVFKEKSCQALTPVDQQQLQAAFANGNVDPAVIVAAGNNNTAIQACLCNWSASALSPDGAGAACVAPGASGAAPICNATEIAEAATQMKPLAALLKCGSATAPANGTETAPPPAAGASGSGAASVGVPMVLSVAVLAIVAAIGL